MKHSRFSAFLRRCCALALAAALALPIGVSADQGEPRLTTVQTILDGLTYTNTVSEHPSGRTESFTLELEEDGGVFPILLQSSGTIYGSATINAAVKQAQALGYQVLAAVNTDYFSTSTGVPMGIVIEDGVYKSDADGNPAMAVVDGGVVLCEAPEVSLTLTNEENDKKIVPNYFNKYRAATGGVYLLNEHFSSVSTRTSTSGWFVRMEVVDYDPEDEDCLLGVNSELELEVTELLQTSGAITIGPGEYILTADDASNKLSVFQSFQVGDRVTLETECGNDDLSDAQWAGGVGDILVEDGEVTDYAGWEKIDYPDSVRAPRTALGVRRDGTLVLYAVDGRQSKHSVGLTATDLADHMSNQLDCSWAVNLDGGGSTSVSVWVPGQSAVSLQNSPSDGKARPCATYLLLVTDKEDKGRPDRLALTENGMTVLAGSSLTLPEAVALDKGLNLLDEDLDDLTIISRTGLGEIADGVYTAGEEGGTDLLRLRSRDLDVTGEAQIHVVEELSELTVTVDGKTVSSIQVKPGQSVQLGASGTYWGRTALRGLTGVEIELDESLGSVDQNGLLTFASSAAGGEITFSAGGLTRTLPISVRNVHTDVPEGHWAYNAVEYCYDRGIVSGISPTEFGALGQIRRCDFLLMLYAALGRPAVSTPCTFTDVSKGDYFYTALAWAQSQGLISSNAEGACLATQPINREQTFTILRRALPLLGKDCPDAPLSALSSFRDKDAISDYAKGYAATLVAQGLVGGSDGAINPQGTLTRAETAVLLHKICTYSPITEYPDYEPDPVVPETPEQPQNVLPLGALPAGAAMGVVTDAEAGLNVRSGPGTEYEVQEKLKNEAAVLILAKSGGWYEVLYRSPGNEFRFGFISADYVALKTLAGTVTDAQAGLNVRSGPGTGHEVLTKLADGTNVLLVDRKEGWYEILYLTAEKTLAAGYVSADYITVSE